MSRFVSSIESLRQAIHYQEDIHSHKLLVRIYLQQNNLPEAIASLERIVERNPVFPGHYRELVDVLKKQAERTVSPNSNATPPNWRRNLKKENKRIIVEFYPE